MDETQIRLACLKLARPDGVSDPDANKIIERAKLFVDFVTADKVKAPATKPVVRPQRP